MIKRDELIKIGTFNKPHGIHGEVSFIFTDDIFDRTECPYLVCEIDGIFVPFFIEEYRFKSDTSALIKFEDIDTEEEARLFTNLTVYFPKTYLGDEEEIEEAQVDYFIGYTISDATLGSLGKIIDIDDATINILFVVEHEGKEVLIPANDDFVVSVDEENKIIYMSIPPELLTL
ncbi:ribosome maturation factor RimM [Coprobacter tertius]|uniref:Ribosome maturation factor RimM n=1 Tax=Coprobacter tertius TaxID=2944915 RepID=A0ABT1MHS1_9BACT|nr:ribosome maturation factor RimM [Coprobacter tertius]MCP9611924.1 ribosome maturation factor RimM [Coprobacter tertius]